LDLAKTLIDQGRNELSRSRSEAALAAFDRAGALRASLLGQQHPLTAAAWISAAEVHCRQEQWEAAAELGNRAIQVLDQAPEPIPGLIAAACSVVARAAAASDQAQLAESQTIRELALHEESAGKDHAILVPGLLRLGRIHKSAERIDEALRTLQRGLAIAERAHGTHDPAVVPFLEELCSLRATDGPTELLEPLVERYLKCHVRAYGNQSAELSQAQDQAAEWYRVAGNETRAQELNEQALSLREMSMHVFGELM
jgi:tetratricopeptide (TPR) repeat protein